MIILLLSQMQASVTAKTTTNPRPIGWQSLKSDNLSLGGYTLARVVKKKLPSGVRRAVGCM